MLLNRAAIAQRVLIQNASSDRVIEVLKTHLLPQGFVFVKGDSKRALFTLDRGMVNQSNVFDCKTHVNLLHVVMELNVRFKQKDAGLEVSVFEQAVGSDQCGESFRRTVGAGVEVEHLQQLLDQIKGEVEREAVPADTGDAK